MELKNWDKASKESIAVAVCNGAVYEPKFKRNWLDMKILDILDGNFCRHELVKKKDKLGN